MASPKLEHNHDVESGTSASEKEVAVDRIDTEDSVSTFASATPEGIPVEKDKTTTASNLSNTDPNIVFWSSPDDPENPMNWPHKLKLINVVFVSTWTFLTPLASSMVAPGIINILGDFHSTSVTLASFIVSIFILGYAIGPLVVAPMSEIYGRLPIYHALNTLFVIWTLACAFAPSLSSLLVFRFFQGVAGVTPLTIGSGTIADLIPSEQRGKFMSFYSIGPLLGPVIGPIAGAFLNQAEGWRWIFRVLAIAVCVPSRPAPPID